MNYPITILLIIICGIVYFLQYQSGEEFTSKYAMMSLQVKRGQYYRLLTSGFLHGNISHLLMNMLALYNLGSALEPFLGSVKFLIAILLSIVGGNLMVYLKERRTVMTVGISGGLYGLMFIYFVFLWSLGLLTIPSIRNSVLRTILINAFITFMPGISMYGHLGGALSGIILGLLFSFIL